MVNIEIDGKKLEVAPGAMVIEAADAAGIYIPRFCYHKKLSIAANCRMCLVEVEKVKKPLPACATPVTEGMRVFTKSPMAKESQKIVMEFLLINHPLDCPICDQGGECELQDLALGYGRDISLYTEGKRAVEDEDLGSLISTEMTRCIHCTRCVRFGDEIAGIRELGATHRGERMRIETFVANSLTSEVSGNIIDLCPVGALTAKPSRFVARPWELEQRATVAAHDCLGSNIYVHVRRDEVMRVVPKENETINETWLSDRDRFSYAGLRQPDRVSMPLVKRQGRWEEVDWSTALDALATSWGGAIKKFGADQTGALVAPTATVEEHYLLQKWMRQLGSHNIDHRLRHTDNRDDATAPLFPSLGITLSELEQQQTILLVGSNIQREQPLAGLRIGKAVTHGAKFYAINTIRSTFNFAVAGQTVVNPTELPRALAAVAKVVAQHTGKSLPAALAIAAQNINPSDLDKAIAQQLVTATPAFIGLGAVAQHHPQAALLRDLVQAIAQLSGAKWGSFTDGPNSAGAWLAGAVPHRGAGGHPVMKPGLTAAQMLAQPLKAYIVMGFEPELDVADPYHMVATLAQAECVVALSSYMNPMLAEHADIILPLATQVESSGHYVNVEGRWQNFKGVVAPYAEARPGWKILRVMGNYLNLDGFDYNNSEEVIAEVKNLVDNAPSPTASRQADFAGINDTASQELCRITEWPLYAVDPVVRRAQPLQASAANEAVAARVSPALAQRLNLNDGDVVTVIQGQGQAQLLLAIDDRIPDASVYVSAGTALTAQLGASFGPIQVKRG